MNINFLLLYCALSFINVVLQTVKSLCTVKCSTFVSALVNAIAYGLYVFVIFYTNAEGLSLWGKALITATANFTGVYLANILFNKIFAHEVTWKIEISIPLIDAPHFTNELENNGLEYFEDGFYNGWVSYAVFCPTKEDSRILKTILPNTAKYNVSECVKRL